jgi:hypothetical protein
VLAYGKARSFHVLNVTGKTLKPILNAHVAKNADLCTDDSLSTAALEKTTRIATLNHSKGEYVRGDAHTNTVEDYFSILKRGLIGTYHHVGENHLQRYVREFDFRYNNRESLGVNDTQRANAALKGIRGKRLTYRRTDLRQNP